MSLIPKVEGNKLTIHENDDLAFKNPIVIIEFESALDLIKFTKQICFESNIAYYLTDITIQNEISIM